MATAAVERKLAAIMAADVAGFSRLMGADEDGTHASLKAHLRELIEPNIREHRGRMVKTTGDGFLATFESVIDAVIRAAELGTQDDDPLGHCDEGIVAKRSASA